MDPKILDKIKKCLRLAHSSNANEAATALRQAQLLMEKNGISTDDVAMSDVENYSTPAGAGKKAPLHIAVLVDLVCQAFGAQAIFRSAAYRCGNTWQSAVTFIGLGSAAEIAGYAYAVLLRQLKRDRTAYLKTLNKRLKQSTKVRRADIYCQGWTIAVAEKIIPHQRTEAELTALTKYKEHRFPTLVKSEPKDRAKNARTHDGSAFIDGNRDGKNVRFHQGVKGRKQAALMGS